MSSNTVILSFIETIVGKGVKTSGDNYSFNCPFCNHHKPKLEINIQPNQKGENFWHCWVCDVKGKTLRSLLKKLKCSNDKLIQLNQYIKYVEPKNNNEIEVNIVELPKEFKSLAIKSSDIMYKHAIHYLKKRGVTIEDIIKYNIGYCTSGKYRNSVIIPSYNANGQLNYFISRTFEKESFRKYDAPKCDKNSIIGFEFFINWNTPIILCEGPFDAIAIKRNAIPLFGKNFSQALLKKLALNEVKTVYLALDNDALKKSISHAEHLLSLGKDVYLIDLEEKDPSDLGFEQFTKRLHQARQLTFSKLLSKKIEII